MKNMPIDVLRAFVTVTEVGGFTQAGELLGRSQPAISLQIKRLEEMLGQKLIIRIGKQLELSHAGQSLFNYAKQILSINDEAIAGFSANSVSGRLHLGTTSEFATAILPKILSRFTQTYANITLEVTCDLSKNLLSESKQKQFDLILALHDEPHKAGKELIKEDDLVWVSSADPDVYRKRILPLIVSPEGCIYRSRAILMLNRANQPWRIVYTIPDLSGIQAAIEEGLGITVLARSTVPANLKIIRPSKTLPKLGKVSISLMMRKSRHTEAASRLVEYLKASLISDKAN
ncbi:MAG: LysR substrate-binding domain-containing protein [Gammaproteobacteria bacterium]